MVQVERGRMARDERDLLGWLAIVLQVEWDVRQRPAADDRVASTVVGCFLREVELPRCWLAVVGAGTAAVRGWGVRAWEHGVNSTTTRRAVRTVRP